MPQISNLHPSLSLRKEAARLHEEMTKAEDGRRSAIDDKLGSGTINFWIAYLIAAEDKYEAFCKEHGFRLTTDASRLCLYCAETGIPLVEGDECRETNTGQLVIVKQAA